ncbi:unnamed protein product [Litomosoides sigmodontis]|uniref:Uncharacterized protein n=1 Tax=Litomosoides sigmodontis TaxID=42156 RepID=A0A3P6UAJ0_LITSI|nr:unnamed protein product [Litomosoides sigmodontis]
MSFKPDLKMPTIAFQPMSYLLTALACITLVHSFELLPTDDVVPPEERNHHLFSYLMRVGRALGKSHRTFGGTVRDDAFQASPLIRFGKRYVIDDGRSELLSHLLAQYPQQ